MSRESRTYEVLDSVQGNLDEINRRYERLQRRKAFRLGLIVFGWLLLGVDIVAVILAVRL